MRKNIELQAPDVGSDHVLYNTNSGLPRNNLNGAHFAVDNRFVLESFPVHKVTVERQHQRNIGEQNIV